MKKIVRLSIVFLLFAIVVGVMIYKMPKKFHKLISYLPADCQYSIYCSETSLSCINVGYGKIVNCSKNSLTEFYGKCNQIQGVSASFRGTLTEIYLLMDKLDVAVNSNYCLQDMTVICGYTEKISGGILVDNAKTNIQLAYRNGTITVGSPLILGEY